MSDTVWLLWFEQERDEGEDTELLIGVYRTEQAANDAISRVKDQPGFKDYPEGFHAYEYKLDKDSWTEGFARVP
jgi:homoserine kinase type II